jgi:hypothetical protein
MACLSSQIRKGLPLPLQLPLIDDHPALHLFGEALLKPERLQDIAPAKKRRKKV